MDSRRRGNDEWGRGDSGGGATFLGRVMFLGRGDAGSCDVIASVWSFSWVKGMGVTGWWEKGRFPAHFLSFPFICAGIRAGRGSEMGAIGRVLGRLLRFWRAFERV